MARTRSPRSASSAARAADPRRRACAVVEPVPRRLLPAADAERATRRDNRARGRGGRRARHRRARAGLRAAGRRATSRARARDDRATASSALLPYAERARRAAGDRAAAPDDDRRALGDRHARRGARPRRAVRRPAASASSSTPTTCGGTRGSTSEIAARRAAGSSASTSPTGSSPTADRAARAAGMMGDGIDRPAAAPRRWSRRPATTGPIEVEVINREAWARPGDEIVAEACAAFVAAA